MKKILGILCFFIITQSYQSQNNSRISPYAEEVSYDANNHLNLITFKESHRVNEDDVAAFINSMILNNGSSKVSVFKLETDELGWKHTKFNITQKGIPLVNKLIIAHVKNGKLISLNGDLYEPKVPTNKFSLSEKTALNFAVKKVKAEKYKWQNKEETEHMREALNQPDFSYFPKGLKVIYEKEGKYYNVWQFNIYAEVPLYRANIYVDASSGKVLGEDPLICNVNAPGSAATKYSGTQTITIDQNGAVYRLRENQRGLGVDTYNMNNTTTYSATDFTNASSSWTSIGGVDQGARDAQWGAQKTYDFYLDKFNRNSINNAGFKLLSYVHYGTSYNNAFWDGQRMTYGDGNGTAFTMFACLDVCGHEITHGVVGNTAMLGGGGTSEADALNEGFADIFGTSIERYTRPTNWNWKMGNEITPGGNGIRNMQNPNQLNDPDTYLGQYWDQAGEPHNNAGPSIYWFYLLVNGGSGTNDLNNAFNVTGIGNTDAEKIAYRALTVYFVPGTTYSTARGYAIQAAKDLFGNCSNQVTQTANAWYAVGVGAQLVPGVINPNFIANSTSFCSLPANVSFVNTTANAMTYSWDFGDGSTSTSTNPIHSYTANGSYNVKLTAIGCANVTDSIKKPAYIVINVPGTPVVTNASACENSSVTLTATGNASMLWYDGISTTVLNSGNSFVIPTLTATTTYYVVNTVTNSPVYGGRLTNANGGFLTNASQWLVFTVIQNSSLNSVVVYAQTNGIRYIELRNSGNTVINSTSVNLTAGTNTVILNYSLQPGSNYQLGLNTGSTADLYRSNSQNTYPYNIGGCVSITGSSAGSGFYYWFYNWKVTKSDCVSPTVSVTASMLPAPTVAITAPSTVACIDDGDIILGGSPTGGIYNGPGVNGFIFSPAAAVSSNTISYSYVAPNGCSNSASMVMLVDLCTGMTSLKSTPGILIYPNPARENLTIKNEGSTGTIANISDLSGRIILSHSIDSSNESIDLSGFSKGLYILSVLNNANKTIAVQKFAKE